MVFFSFLTSDGDFQVIFNKFHFFKVVVDSQVYYWQKTHTHFKEQSQNTISRIREVTAAQFFFKLHSKWKKFLLLLGIFF